MKVSRKSQKCLYMLAFGRAFIVSFVFMSHSASAAKPTTKFQNIKEIPQLVSSGKINKYSIQDPHWKKTLCHTCHSGKATKANKKLIIRDVNRLCNSCHQFVPDNLINHPINIKPNTKMLAKMSVDYKKTLSSSLVQKGTLSCLTCHDVIQQCTPKKFRYKARNREFFRAGPFRHRTDMCFKCHQTSAYKRFNPHKQISASGKIKKNTCHVCHQNVDKLDSIKSVKELKFNVGNDLKKMCIGCHVWQPHPGGELTFGKKAPNHLVVPSKKVTQQMKYMLPKTKVYLPLEPGSGKVYCATCHNVHQKNIIKNKFKSKGADSKNRLRRKKSCDICHVF